MTILLTLALLLPLVFYPKLLNPYTLPKFSILMCSVPLLAYTILRGLSRRGDHGKSMPMLLKVALLVEGASALLATVVSVHPSVSLWGSETRHLGYITVVAYILVTVTAYVSVRSVPDLKRMLQWISIAGVLCGIISLGMYLFKATERLDGTVGNPNYLTNYLLFPTLGAAGLAVACRSWKERVLGGLCVALCLGCISMSGTRGSQVGLVAGTMAMIALLTLSRPDLRSRFRQREIILFGVAILVSGAILAWGLRSRAGMGGSGRLMVWRDSLPLLSKHWLLGTGLEGFRVSFMKVRSFELARYYPEVNWRTAHNAALDTWITTGLAGLVGYSALVVAGLWGWWKAAGRIASSSLATPMPTSLAMVAGCGGALAAYLVHNLFNCDVLETGLYFHLFVGLGWGVYDGLGRPAAETETSSPTGKIRLVRWLAISLTVIMAFGALVMAAADSAAYRSWELAGPKGGDTEQSIVQSRNALKLCLLPSKGHYHYAFARAMDRAWFSCSPEKRERVLSLSLDHAERAMAFQSTAPEGRAITLASLYLRAGRTEEAMESVNTALEHDPNFWNSHRVKAMLLLREEQPVEALEWAASGMHLNPSHIAMSQIYERAWDANTPAEARTAYGRGNSLLDGNKYSEAAAAYRDAVRLASDRYPKAWNNLGYAYELLGNLAEAKEAYHRALDLTDGHFAVAQAGLGSVLIKQGLLDSAILHLEEACDLQPDWPLPWRHLLFTHHRLGNETEAQRCLDEYLTRETNEDEKERAKRFLASS